MCYDVRYLTRQKLTYARRFGEDSKEIEKLEAQLRVFEQRIGAVYHSTAFDHWDLPVVTAEKPHDFQFFHWGLIPHFVKDTNEYAAKYTSRYLNSRIETLFDKTMYNESLGKDLDNPFYSSAIERRCVVVIDGYYDWHWQGKNSYNFHVLLKNDEPMIIAGIWREWISRTEGITKTTVSMVTTDANELCRYVHNKPKASEGPRQLAILTNEMKEAWLDTTLTLEQLKKVIRVFPDSEMKAYPVKKLFVQEGRSRIALNDPDCTKEVYYNELDGNSAKSEYEQGSLF